jgi:Spy/CpxP family protein refolding chaperone
MRMNLLIATIAAATLGLGGATTVSAQSPPPGGAQAPGAGAYGDRPGLRGGMPPGRGAHGWRAPGEGPMAGRMAAELNLSDDQKQKLRALREAGAPAVRESAQRLRESRQKLRGMSPEDPGWAASVDEASRLAADAASRGVREGARMRAETWRILTPEQRTKLAALEAKREERMRERLQQRRQRPQNR